MRLGARKILRRAMRKCRFEDTMTSKEGRHDIVTTRFELHGTQAPVQLLLRAIHAVACTHMPHRMRYSGWPHAPMEGYKIEIRAHPAGEPGGFDARTSTHFSLERGAGGRM